MLKILTDNSDLFLYFKACAHWRGLPHGRGLAQSSCGLVDHARSKFHTLAQSYMRSRRGLLQIGSGNFKKKLKFRFEFDFSAWSRVVQIRPGASDCMQSDNI